MNLLGREYTFVDVSRHLTVPDCNVMGPNKIGLGHGEQKYYFGTKKEMYSFFGNVDSIKCFFLKSDLVAYMDAIKCEYVKPTQQYAGVAKFKSLWDERSAGIATLDDIIPFTVKLQNQITGSRGYLNSSEDGYNLFRQLSLPLTSYISIMRLRDPNGDTVYYWKLFVDFDAIQQRKSRPLVFTYRRAGKSKNLSVAEQVETCKTGSTASTGRDAAKQAKYRRDLLDMYPYCPITGISDERILLASHIKPYAASDEDEEFDPENGYILSPLYDNLFDQGLISFTNDRCMMVSSWLSPRTQELCGLVNGKFYQRLPMSDKKEFYLDYHRRCVFKG